MKPDDDRSLIVLAATYGQLGRVQEAKSAVDEANGLRREKRERLRDPDSVFVDQGQELVVIHAEEPRSLLIFYPVVVFWAVNAWYWTRSTSMGQRIR